MRGRGFSRGGTYNGRGGNTYRGNGSSSYHSRGGGSSYTTPRHVSGGRYNPYERDSSRYNDDGDRSFKRPSYNNNNHNNSRDRSIDDRKRSRYDQGSRGSHDSGGLGGGGYHNRSSSSDYNNRYDTSSARHHGGGGGGGRGRRPSPNGSHNTHHSSSSHHHHHNNDGFARPSPSSYRRDTSLDRRRDSMGVPARRPPVAPPPPRISRRGRILSSTYRGRGGRVARTYTDFTLRRRIIPSRPSAMATSRIKSLATRRARVAVARKRALTEDEEDDDDDDEKEANDAEEEVAAPVIKKEKRDVAVEEKMDDEADVKAANDGAADKEVTESVVAVEKVKVEVKEEAAGDGKEKEKATDKVKSSSDSVSAKEKKKKIEILPPPRYMKTFIKLQCPHCHTRHRTFQEYSRHLSGLTHSQTMRKVAFKLRSQMLRMRNVQRIAQRNTEAKEEEEKEEEDDDEDAPPVAAQFCMVCRLNYRQPKATHQASDSHKDMVKFLRPSCKVCRTSFTLPIQYEAHRCSLDHIRRKADAEECKKTADSDSEEADDGGGGSVEKALDLDSFMTVDSVGDVDDEGAEFAELNGSAESGGAAAEEQTHSEINVGVEHVQKMEVYFCDLCRYYLPVMEDIEGRIKRHCASRQHLRAYLRFKDDRDLRLEAERVHRKRQEKSKAAAAASNSKDAAAVAVVVKDEPTKDGDGEELKNGSDKEVTSVATDKKESAPTSAATNNSSVADGAAAVAATKPSIKDDEEKMSDEDKDVSAMLETSNFEDDDDSRINSERYDRFRYSGDQQDELVIEADEDDAPDAKEVA